MPEQNHNEPIPGPINPGPEWDSMRDEDRPAGPALILGRKLMELVRGPLYWIRENIVLPNKGEKYYWYHRKYPRALPIDECYVDDLVCIYEADQEFRRNRLIDREMMKLLKWRVDGCEIWNRTQSGWQVNTSSKCDEIREIFTREEIRFFTKYGDLRYDVGVVETFNKQKHRMIMERRRAAKAEQEAAAAATTTISEKLK